MSLDKNYSTINELNKVFSIDENYRYFSRTIVSIKKENYAENISTGDIIRYDPTAMQYVKSFANVSSNAEVFGIVESINADQSLNVVTNGSVTLNSNLLINISGSNLGGNDIYFLSGITSGKLQNIGPTGSDNIIKPLYYISPHGNFTGLFRNYIGYRNGTFSLSGQFSLATLSDNGIYALYYNQVANKFLLYSFSYSTSTTTRIIQKSFELPPEINFNISNNFDIKISNDGLNLLIFDKINTNKRIFYIIFDGSNPVLKQTIFIKMSGNPSDILFACDDELSSFTVSSRALYRQPKNTDFRITAHDSCSRILYYKRNINDINPYTWRKIHEQAAFGFCDYVPRDEYKFAVDVVQGVVTSGISDNDLEISPGIFRTCDVYCKNKNYGLSTFCLDSDQVAYKSKNTGYYLKYILTTLPDTIQNNFIKVINSIDGGLLTSTPYNAKSQFINDIPVEANENGNRFYKCNFGIKQFKIHKKINNYYYEDLSFLQTNTIKFYRPFAGSLNLSTNASLPTGLGILSQLASQGNPSDSDATSNPYVDKIPTYTQNALWSSICCTDTFFVFALLYEYKKVSNNAKTKILVVIKFPFDSHDGKNVFRFFTESSTASGIIPTLGSNGLISNFISTATQPSTDDYFNTTLANLDTTLNGSVESPNLINQTTLTNPNIDQLTNFKIFTSDLRYFLCTPTHVIVWTYSSSTYIILSNNFINSKFYHLASGEYFINDNILYYYNPSTQVFVQQTITE